MDAIKEVLDATMKGETKSVGADITAKIEALGNSKTTDTTTDSVKKALQDVKPSGDVIDKGTITNIFSGDDEIKTGTSVVIVSSLAGSSVKMFVVEGSGGDLKVKYKAKKVNELSELSVDLMEFSDVKKFINKGLTVCSVLEDKKDDLFKEYDDTDAAIKKVEKPVKVLLDNISKLAKNKENYTDGSEIHEDVAKDMKKEIPKVINKQLAEFRKFSTNMPKFTLDKITGIMHTAKDIAWYANMTLSYYK
jgi:uncharacterized protein YhaN